MLYIYILYVMILLQLLYEMCYLILNGMELNAS